MEDNTRFLQQFFLFRVGGTFCPPPTLLHPFIGIREAESPDADEISKKGEIPSLLLEILRKSKRN